MQCSHWAALRSTLSQNVATLTFLLLLCAVVMYLTGDLIRGVSCWTKSVIKYLCIYLSIYMCVSVCVYIFIWQGIGYIFILCVLKSFCMHIHIHSFTHSHSTMVFTLLLFPVVVCAFLSRYLNDSTLSKVPCFYWKKSQNEVSDRFALKRALAYSCVHSSLCLHTTFLARMKTI